MGPVKCYIGYDSVLGPGPYYKNTKLQKVQLVDKSIVALSRKERLSRIKEIYS